MTADNVEQLMEIVRALQTGEDPEAALQKKKAESAPQADSPKSNLEEDALKRGSTFGTGKLRKLMCKRAENADLNEKEEAEDTESADDALAQSKPAYSAEKRAGSVDTAAKRRDCVGSDSEQADLMSRKVKQRDSAQDSAERTNLMSEAGKQRDFVDDAAEQANSISKTGKQGDAAERMNLLSAAVKRMNSAKHSGSARSRVEEPDDFQDDEFEKNLLEDSRKKLEKPDINAMLDRVSESLWKFVQKIDRVIDPATAGKREKKKQERSVNWADSVSGGAFEPDENAEAVKLMHHADADMSMKADADINTKAKESVNVRTEAGIKHEASAEPADRSDAEMQAKPDETGENVMQEKTEDQKTIDRIFESTAADTSTADTSTAETIDSGAEDSGQNSGDNSAGQNLPETTTAEDSVNEKTENGNTEKENIEKENTGKPRKGRKTDEKSKSGRAFHLDSLSPSALKESAGDLSANLREKGIGHREIVMILLVVVLAVVIVVMIVNGVRGSLEEKQKSKNVTADSGLIVTVEDEPEQWCSSYSVQLRFRTQRAPVTKVTINGTVLQPDAKGYVTFETSDYVLEAEAETENGTLKAQIEIPKLDSQAPFVSASRAQNQITLTGADARSAIKGIWYAVVHEDDPIQLPRYQEYSGAIPFEENAMYYFYAQDQAGNRSDPVVTNMETADAIGFAQEEVCMYPDETVYLELQESPEGALLNNLRYESMNPDIISVDKNGAVTALKEGTAAVRVSADGVESANCIITVSSTRTVTLSAIGDCVLGSDESFNTTTNFDAYDAVNGHSYFFKNVKDILENDDVTFANLECALTTETTRENKTYAFKGDPSYTEVLAEGSVEVVTLANNHSSDYGEKSYDDTVRYLTEAGIDYCSGTSYAMRKINGVNTAFVGVYVLRDGMAVEDEMRETIAAAKEAGAQLVIVAFHWGSEKSTEPDETQRSLAHSAVDCGADLVVGHHPHVLQGIEKYNGKYIVYSLANFCFGGNTAPADKDTMIFRQTFTISDGVVQDDDQIEIIPCSVSSVSDYNNYQPTPASGEEADRIMARINEYSQEFGQTYAASSDTSLVDTESEAL